MYDYSYCNTDSLHCMMALNVDECTLSTFGNASSAFDARPAAMRRVRSKHADSMTSVSNGLKIEDHQMVVYFRINRNTGSPNTMFVMWRNDPVRDMSKPPNDAYAVLKGAEEHVSGS